MWYVYLLRSKADRRRTYVGLTQTLKARFTEHNSGKSIHTNKFNPWTLVTYLAFSTKTKANKFERYLKTGSGRAFANRHLW